jgi:hypothetical protein
LYNHQPRLKKSEYDSDSTLPEHWTGIDCSSMIYYMLYGTSMFSNILTSYIIYSTNYVGNQGASCYQIDSSKWNCLHKGDIIASLKHMVMIYNEPPLLSNYYMDNRYISVINSYGSILHNNPDDTSAEIFGRKAIIMQLWDWYFRQTNYNILNYANDYSIGRMRLWR